MTNTSAIAAQQYVLVCPVCGTTSRLGTGHCKTCGMELSSEDMAPAHRPRRFDLFGIKLPLAVRCGGKRQDAAFATC